MLPTAGMEMPIIWTFMHDNDPTHTAKIVKMFIAGKNIPVLDRPPQSPDLNPIENLRYAIDKPTDRSKATNLVKLWVQIKKEWYSISVEECRRLVSSMGKRSMVSSKLYEK